MVAVVPRPPDGPRDGSPAAGSVMPGAAGLVVRAGDEHPAEVFIALEQRLRAARTPDELAFTLANESYRLLPFRQAHVWVHDGGGRPVLHTVSGLATLESESPLTVWLRDLGRWLGKRMARRARSGGHDAAGDAGAALPGIPEPEFIDVSDVPPALADGWAEWMTPYLFVLPVVDPRDGRLHAIVAFAADPPPDEDRQQWLLRLSDAAGHAWSGLVAGRRRLRPTWRRALPWLVALALLAAMAIPVPMSALAPAEVIGLDAEAIAAPMDGVINEFRVAPNEAVRKGQVLFTLDDTTLRNRRLVALRALDVARAEALAAQQKAFDDARSRADVGALQGKVAEKQAEVTYVNDLLARIEVRAPRDGIVVFGDVNDWQGKPVVTGERIAQLADPANAGVLIWLPVADALALAPGAPVRMFLQVAPLSPLPATLVQTSYQAVPSPDGVASYRLKARLDVVADEGPGGGPAQAQARIGLKGTAKLWGGRAPLGYFLFRRPLSALRAWSGL